MYLTTEQQDILAGKYGEVKKLAIYIIIPLTFPIL